MSRKALFQNAAQRLLATPLGAKIYDSLKGEMTDTGVQTAIEEVVAVLMSGVIEANETIEIRSTVNNGPIMRIIDEGGNASTGIEVVRPDGSLSRLGVGGQSLGIIANEFVPYPPFMLSPLIANIIYGNQGGNPRPSTVGDTGYGQPGSGSGKALLPYGSPAPTTAAEADAKGAGDDSAFPVTAVSVANFFQSATPVVGIPGIWQFTWNNHHYYLTTTEPPVGLTDNLEIVIPEITCEDGEIVYATKWLVIVNGLITAVEDEDPDA